MRSSTGLGLSIPSGIVEQHGGRLRAESEPGSGAAFHIELSMSRDDVAGPAEQPSDPLAVPGMDVLVVDDEADIREIVSRQLVLSGCNVTIAAGGEEAWQLLQQHEYDVVVLDLRMPGMDGLALFRRVEEMDESIAKRVVFMTGDVLSLETQRFLERAGRPTLSKPFSGHEMRRLIAQFQTRQHDQQ